MHREQRTLFSVPSLPSQQAVELLDGENSQSSNPSGTPQATIAFRCEQVKLTLRLGAPYQPVENPTPPSPVGWFFTGGYRPADSGSNRSTTTSVKRPSRSIWS